VLTYIAHLPSIYPGECAIYYYIPNDHSFLTAKSGHVSQRRYTLVLIGKSQCIDAASMHIGVEMGKRVRRSNKSRRSNQYEPNVTNMLDDLEYEMGTPTSEDLDKAYQQKVEELEKEYQQKAEELQRRHDEDMAIATEKAFLMMLHFPLEALLRYYWSKANKRKLEKFIEHTLDIYKGYIDGTVDIAEIKEHLWEHGGIRIIESISSL